MYSNEEIISIFKRMIRINTTNPPGDEHLLCAYIASIFDSNNVEYEIIKKAEKRENIIALKGPKNSLPPIILISHLDVVSVDGQDWTHPPFDAVEVDSIIYGRGTVDTKHLTVMQLIAFLSVDESSLDCPLYFVATSDEEKGSNYGMRHVAHLYKDEFKNGSVINEGGGFYIENGDEGYSLITMGEKGRCDVKVKIKGDSGPSSFKSENKAVDIFTTLLDRMSSYQFEEEENPVSIMFNALVKEPIHDTFLSHFTHYNSHNAFILNSYDIGKQVNVLPYNIEFNFAIQLLPGKTKEDAKSILSSLFEGLSAEYEIVDFLPGFISSLDTPLYEAANEHFTQFFEGGTLLPVFALGRTDGRFLGQLGCDVYGFSPINKIIDFHTVLTLVHQVDERIDRNSVIQGAALFSHMLHHMRRTK